MTENRTYTSNLGYYPNLTKLYRRLGIELKPTNFTFSFAMISQALQPFLLYNGQSGVRGFSLPTGKHRPTNLQYLHFLLVLVTSYMTLLLLAIYHHFCGHLLDPHHRLAKEPLKVWVKRHELLIRPIFVHAVLVTLFSAMATSSRASILEMPASEVLLYISSTFLRSHLAVKGGVQTVQKALIRNIDDDHIHLSASVERIEYSQQSHRAVIFTEETNANLHRSMKRYDGFHHIVLATPAVLSAAILQSYIVSLKSEEAHEELIRRILSMQKDLRNVQYEESTVVTHADVTFLPGHTNDWRDLNLVAPYITEMDHPHAEFEEKPIMSHTMATHLLSSPENTGNVLLQTTNPLRWPATNLTFRVSKFYRALTPSSKKHRNGLFIWERRWSPRWRHWKIRFLSLLGQTNASSWSQTLDLHHDWMSDIGGLGRPWTLQLGESQTQQGSPARSSCIWACGSYAQGIPLLEGCVTSSTLVAAKIISL